MSNVLDLSIAPVSIVKKSMNDYIIQQLYKKLSTNAYKVFIINIC